MQYSWRLCRRTCSTVVQTSVRWLTPVHPARWALLALSLAASGCANLGPMGSGSPVAGAAPVRSIQPAAPIASASALIVKAAGTTAQPGGSVDTALPVRRELPGTRQPAAVPPSASRATSTALELSANDLLPAQTALSTQVTVTDVPRIEPALPEPLTRATDTSPSAVETNLWVRIRSGFALPALPTPLVADKERFYLTKPDYLQRMFDRGGRYLFHIVEELEKRGMPTELALLPFVESAMNPVALSPAQASGLWQFIPSTGKAYDLQQDWWVDNRRDVVKSTQAALDYLQKIYTMHGNDWFLALASYNWGEGSVARAIRKNQALGRPTDYLSLPMPNETRQYVPKLIALKNLLLNADSLGLKLPELPNRPYFVTLEKTRPIDLQLAAKFARMSVEEFVALNPAHNRPVISPGSNNEIKLPADRLDHYKAAMANHEADSKAFATWQPYTLKAGETLDMIAQRSGVPMAELRRANGLREGSRIVAGTRLLTPQTGIANDRHVENFLAPRVYELVDRPAQYHTVAGRETLASIASRYRISAASLAAWNGIRKGIAKGMRLLVQPAGTQTLLTAENGNRTVVAQTTTQPAAIELPTPSAGSQKADRPQPEVATRLVKVSAAAPRKAASGKGLATDERSLRKEPGARADRAAARKAPTRTASDRRSPKV